ncbi:MAG: 2-polyprenyl-3-methyl-6-methoxy-1,4-benzoquinone monooxygenase [Ectothiorhodospiraceae bacterium]|nr:2-polyprenyl-3-methyl-6-methoxy-1,4-benzoquinone monooxygenase [Chromatiales bacterium]MCP5153632.1 2-polyprenyl-3-methyl-6-methoxy-1,4-benzoquinone monooxygenase [Ectothiorhodospiraceae bacterium]
MAASGFLDRLVVGLDEGLRIAFDIPRSTPRPSPAEGREEPVLTPAEQRHSIGLVRVDHAGEVAAQGLYHGQLLLARDPGVRDRLERAADEERDHLAWCRARLDRLGGAPSRLDPFWYAGSFTIGALAALGGDRVSLGFVAETERQVMRHLEGHLASLPAADTPSRAVIEQMHTEEAEHAHGALDAGGVRLPAPVRGLMRMVAKVMTTTAYRV